MQALDILYESAWTLVIYKPAGLSSEASPYYTSAEAQVQHYLHERERKSFVGVVHRLDRAVSGVLLFAKRKTALRHLHEQFRLRQVQKTYLAWVAQAPALPEATLEHYLWKDMANRRAVASQPTDTKAQICRLHYRTRPEKPDGSLLEIQLDTGRFHQIRAQLAAIGCPIIGDTKYGAQRPWQSEAIALHAWQLRFVEPLDGSEHTVEAPPPSAFTFS